MSKCNASPCLTCTRVKDAAGCENKQCKVWSSWFLGKWAQIHGFYEKYGQEKG